MKRVGVAPICWSSLTHRDLVVLMTARRLSITKFITSQKQLLEEILREEAIYLLFVSRY